MILLGILSGIPMVGYRNDAANLRMNRRILSGIPMVGYRNLLAGNNRGVPALSGIPMILFRVSSKFGLIVLT